MEVLKPGAVYRECAVVNLDIKPLTETPAEKASEGNELVDDGEYGGEVMGRRVWETYEQQLKDWHKPANAS